LGRQYDRKRQYFYLCSACLIFFLLFACTAFKETIGRQKTDEHIMSSRLLLANGDYKGAIAENQAVLSGAGENRPADEALFNMGLIYAHYGNPDKDYGRALDYFRKLVKEYPKSPLTEQAKIWSGVLRDMEKSRAEKSAANESAVMNDRVQRVRQMVTQGNYREALKEAQSIMSEPAGSPNKDQAVFYAGLIYAHYGNPDKNYKRSIAYFEQLIREYPQSYLVEQARIMIDILNVIEKAKQVDIEIEKKKKELTR
jgi:outer membrane protein assembly factor BamD (BamD/ComL family)